MLATPTAEPFEQQEQTAFRHQLTRWLAGFMTVFILLATIVRPIFVELSSTFMAMGLANSGIAGAIYLATANPRVVRFAPIALCCLGAVLLVPLMLISGGVNSQFTFLAPLLPVVCALIAGRNAAVLVAIALCALTLLMWVFAETIPDLTGEPFHSAKTAGRALWLILAIVLGTVFSWQFDTALSRLQAQLRSQATLDPLTGLANRRALDTFIEHREAGARKDHSETSVLMLDVDHFKAFNDRYGHAAGDECLRQVGRAIGENTRTRQDFAARFGGEEFVVVLTSTTAEQSLIVAEHLREAIAELPAIAPAHHGVTVTVGLAGELPGEVLEQTLKRADQALYMGKRSGRNTVSTADQLSSQRPKL